MSESHDTFASFALVNSCALRVTTVLKNGQGVVQIRPRRRCTWNLLFGSLAVRPGGSGTHQGLALSSNAFLMTAIISACSRHQRVCYFTCFT